VPETVELLHGPAAERAHHHRTHEHRDAGAGDDAHRGDGTDDATAVTVDVVTTGETNQQRQQVGDHRPHQAAGRLTCLKTVGQFDGLAGRIHDRT
jgi:hypothetical protein